jgi:hypothetical protein
MLLLLAYAAIGFLVGRAAFRKFLDWTQAEFSYVPLDGGDYLVATLVAVTSMVIWPVMLVCAGLFMLFKKDYDKRKFHDAS